MSQRKSSQSSMTVMTNTKYIILFILLFIGLVHVFHKTYMRERMTSSEATKFVPKMRPDHKKFSDGPTTVAQSQYSAPNMSWQTSSGVNLMKRIVQSELRDDEFLQSHLRRQRERHNQRGIVCDSIAGPSSVLQRPNLIHANNVWVNEEYKFVFCSIPKVACTSWKSVLLVLNGVAMTTDQFSPDIIHENSGEWIKQLRHYSLQEQDHILKTYTKAMFSRDPFSRLLSAFQNKLAPNSSFARAFKWQAAIGTEILYEYRDGWKASRDTYDLKFSEFAQFVSSGRGVNRHWKRQTLMCMPCDIDYTILGHFETIEEDADFILQVIGADESVSFPSPKDSYPTNSSNKRTLTSHYETLTDDQLRDLYEFYRNDFELFGYSPPDRLNDET